MKYYYLKRYRGIFKYHQNGLKYGFRYRYYLNHQQHEISHRGFKSLHQALTNLHNVSNLKSNHQSNLTLTAWYHHYLSLIKPPVRKLSTYLSYQHLLGKHVIKVLGNYQLNQLNLDLYQTKVINQMFKKGLAHRTVMETNARMQTLLNYAVKGNVLKVNPLRFTTISQTNLRPKKLIMTTQQKKRFKKVLKHQPINYQVLFKTLAQTGMRVGELLALTFHDVDLTHHLIHIYQTRDELGIRSAKTIHSIRNLKITNQLNTLLAKYAIYCNKHYQVAPSSLLLRGIKGKPMLPNEPSVVLKHLLRLSNLNQLVGKFTPHSFRHMFASNLIDKGISPITVSSILGHSSVDTTLKIYAQSTGKTPNLQKIMQQMKS